MHKLLAYKFAAWLSPEFELFVYKIFEEAIKEKYRLGSPLNPAKPGDQIQNKTLADFMELYKVNPEKGVEILAVSEMSLERRMAAVETKIYKAEFEAKQKELQAPTFYYTVKEYNDRFMKIHKLTYEISGAVGSICSQYCKRHGIKRGGAVSPFSYPADVLDHAFTVYLNNPNAAPTKGKRPGDANQLRLAM
jgi:hypothetical protein